MTLEQEIDEMDYESMLSLWRFAPVGHPMFRKPVGDYFAKVMAEKKEKIGQGSAVQASKNIGWEK